jgi:hypothetical protein
VNVIQLSSSSAVIDPVLSGDTVEYYIQVWKGSTMLGEVEVASYSYGSFTDNNFSPSGCNTYNVKTLTQQRGEYDTYAIVAGMGCP